MARSYIKLEIHQKYLREVDRGGDKLREGDVLQSVEMMFAGEKVL